MANGQNVSDQIDIFEDSTLNGANKADYPTLQKLEDCFTVLQEQVDYVDAEVQTLTGGIPVPVISSTPPVNVTKATAATGVLNTVARSDHKHDIATAAASSLAPGSSNSEGSSSSLARADHSHALPAFGTSSGTFAQGNDARIPTTNEKAALAGTSGTPPSTSNKFVDDADSRLSDARTPTTHASSHVTGGSDVIPNAAANGNSGLLSGADKAKLDGISAGAAALTSSAPADVTKASAAVGVATAAARADHKHDISTAAASTLSVGGSNAEGTATSLARSDHTHALPAFGITAGTFAQGNDSRFPTSQEKDALAGTSGSPSSSNKFVTDGDSRLTDSRAPTGAASGDLSGSYPSPSVTAVTDATSAQLAIGTINNGEFVKRVGASLVSAAITINDADATTKGILKLTNDLGGTAALPVVEGLQGDALPSAVANGFLKRNSGNTAWEEVAFGSSANTVTQGNDSRLSDSRAPTGSAGGDLGGTYPNPTVAAIHETGGPTKLTFGTITDGEFLKRSGTTIVSAGAGSTVSDADASTKGILKLANDLSGTADSPTVVGMKESGGQDMTIGAISDGQILKRSGTSVVGNAVTGSGNVVMSASPTLTGTMVAAAATLSGLATLNGGFFVPANKYAEISGDFTLDYGTNSLVISGTTGSLDFSQGSNAIVDVSGASGDCVIDIGSSLGGNGPYFVHVFTGSTVRQIEWKVAGLFAVNWAAGTDPILQANTVNIFMFTNEASNSSWYGCWLTTMPSDATPAALGAASPGVSEAWSRSDHVHPTTGLIASGASAGGDLTGTYPNPTIGANKVTNSQLRTGAAHSVIGRSANSSGNVADIASSADNQVLMQASSALTFAQLAASNLSNGTTGSGSIVLATSPTIASPQLSGAPATPFASSVTPSGTTATVDFATSSHQTLDLSSASGDVTLTMSGGTDGQVCILQIIQGATYRNVTWPSNVYFEVGSSAPTIPRGNAVKVYIGFVYYGALSKFRMLFTSQVAGSVIDETANTTLTTSDVGLTFTNNGASGEVDFTLCSGVPVNCFFDFHVRTAQVLKIIAPASTTIRVGSKISSAAGSIQSNVIGSHLRLRAYSATEYEAESVVGTWNDPV